MPDLTPEIVELKLGLSYGWCGPKCEHTGLCNSSCTPIVHEQFTADRTKAAICRCKLTATPPFCDGSHLKEKQEA